MIHLDDDSGPPAIEAPRGWPDAGVPFDAAAADGVFEDCRGDDVLMREEAPRTPTTIPEREPPERLNFAAHTPECKASEPLVLTPPKHAPPS